MTTRGAQIPSTSTLARGRNSIWLDTFLAPAVKVRAERPGVSNSSSATDRWGLTDAMALLARLDWFVFLVGIAALPMFGKRGAALTLLAAVLLALEGVLLATNIGGCATGQIGRHRVVKPWGRDVLWAWRLWGAVSVVFSGVLAAATFVALYGK